MQRYAVRRHIAAPPERVWAALTDPAVLTAGTGITRLDGAPGPGARFRLWAEVSGARGFAIRVRAWEPPGFMLWESGMPFGLFRGRRSFRLAAAGAGTDFAMDEVFSGVLAGPICRSMPDLTPSFEQFAGAIASAAEGGQT